MSKTKNRLYFLQDLKSVLEKHDAVLEIDSHRQGYGDIAFTYDIHSNDYHNRQLRNELGGMGEYGSDYIQNLIDNELENNVK